MVKPTAKYPQYLSNILTTGLLVLFIGVIILKTFAIQTFLPHFKAPSHMFLSVLYDIDLFFLLATILVISNWFENLMIGILVRICIFFILLVMMIDIFFIIQEQSRFYYPEIFTYLDFSDIYATKYESFTGIFVLVLAVIAATSFFKPSKQSKYPTFMLFVICTLISGCAVGLYVLNYASIEQMLTINGVSNSDLSNIATIFCIILTVCFPLFTWLISEDNRSKKQIFQSVTCVMCGALFYVIASDEKLNDLTFQIAEETTNISTLHDKLANELQHKTWLLPNIVQKNYSNGIDQPLNAKGIPLTLVHTPEINQMYRRNTNENPANNVIIVIWNTLTWQDVGILPDTAVNTPGLVKIAQEGRTYLNAYANGINDIDGVVSIFAGDIPIPPPRSIFDLGDTSSTSLPVSPMSIVKAMNYFQYNTSFYGMEEISEPHHHFLSAKLGFSHIDINETKSSHSKKIENAIDKVLQNLTDYSTGVEKSFTIINTAYHSLNRDQKALETKETDRYLLYFYERLKAYQYFDDGVMLIIGNAPNIADIHPMQIATNSVKALSHIPVIALGKGITQGKDSRLFSQIDISHNLADLIGYSTSRNLQNSSIIPITIDTTFPPNLNMFQEPRSISLSEPEQPSCINLHNRIYIDSIWYICNSVASDSDHQAQANNNATAINLADITVNLAPDQLYQIELQAEQTRFVTQETGINLADKYIFAINLRRQSADIISINRIHWLLFKIEGGLNMALNYIDQSIDKLLNG